MLTKIQDLLEKTNNVEKSSYFWNALNAVLSALQCPLILMVITRVNGLDDGGVFSIAFAVASLMLYVSLYGLRRFQASDIHEEFSFADYHGMRFLTSGLMILISFFYCLFRFKVSGYSAAKAAVVFLVCAIKLVQGYSDVIHGNMQQKGRLDVATKCSSFRYILEMLALAVVLILTKDLVYACLASVLVSFAGLFLTSVNAGRRYAPSLRPAFRKEKLRRLFIEGFPLFLSLFLNMYISNAPKYAIDSYLTEEAQAIYNIIFMPTFMILLLSNFIFNPIIRSYAELWFSETEEGLAALKKKIRFQVLLVAGLTLLALLVAWTIGIPVLEIIFGAELSEFRADLTIIMIGGGALAYSTFFNTVITIMREQRLMILCYILSALTALFLSKPLVLHEGIRGAVILYTIIMVVLALLLAVMMGMKLAKKGRVLQEES